MIDNVLLSQISSLTREQQIWLNGYLSGSLSIGSANSLPVTSQVTAKPKDFDLQVVYITETGNCKMVANNLASEVKKIGSRAKVDSGTKFDLSKLKKVNNMAIIVSTHGDGDIPEMGTKIYNGLQEYSGDLSHVNFAVLALGDTSYPYYCKAGEDFESVLLSKNAKKALDLVKCDVDFEAPSEAWIKDLCNVFGGVADLGVPEAVVAELKGVIKTKGLVTKVVNLNDNGSDKETYHIEFETDEKLKYKPGDAVGIIPQNIGVDENLRGLSLYNFSEKVQNKLEPILGFKPFSLDEIKAAKPDLVEQCIPHFDPISPRLYSIASCNLSHEDELHILVGLVSYEKDGQQYYGLASNYLKNLKVGDYIDLKISPNNMFKLPDGDTDIIMIGSGTGVAPFRSFVHQRNYNGDTGRNWLFFGNPHQRTDFLYQTEWQEFLSSGVLSDISLAFSRDQAEKVYVQDLVLQNSAKVKEWLDGGAKLYICGSKTLGKAVKDVISTFADVENLVENEQILEDTY